MTRRLGLAMLAVMACAAGMRDAAAEVQPLQCPPTAPREWGLSAPARLSGADILSAPRGESIDEHWRPVLVPDGEEIRGRVLHQSWRMNADGPGWSFFVDCYYAGTSRVLRFDAAGLTHCDYFVSPFNRNQPEGRGALHTLTCG